MLLFLSGAILVVVAASYNENRERWGPSSWPPWGHVPRLIAPVLPPKMLFSVETVQVTLPDSFVDSVEVNHSVVSLDSLTTHAPPVRPSTAN